MIQQIRLVGKKFIPKTIRYFLWGIKPKVNVLNTYVLNNPKIFKSLIPIDSKFEIHQVNWSYADKLKKTYSFMGPQAYERKVPPRLNSKSWIGLAVVDTTNSDIAYIAWVIKESIEYFEEFEIRLKNKQFLLKDGFCAPQYRHQGLHTRMEQERINYCVRLGATDIFIQILDDNIKGKSSVISNGYKIFKQNKILSWPVFNINRELYSVIRKPFKKVIK